MKTSILHRMCFVALASVVAAGLLVSYAQAEIVTSWIGTTGSWTNAGNWDVALPTTAHRAVIDNGGTAQLTGSDSSNVDSVKVGGNGNGAYTGTLEINTTGSLTAAGTFAVAYSMDNTGYLTLTNGTVTAGRLFVGSNETSVGTVTQTGGTLRLTGTDSDNGLRLATATGSASVPNGNGSYYMSGGILEGPSAGTAVGFGLLGQKDSYAGTSLFDQSGGIARIDRLYLTARASHSATYKLSGSGELQVNTIAQGGGAGDLQFLFSGGTLRPFDDDMANAYQAMELTGSTSVFSTEDKDGTARLVAIGAIISGTGSLTKDGLGTLSLGGLNTYAGNTVVNAGTLSISNDYLADSSSVSLATGAMMDMDFTGVDWIDTLSLGGVVQSAGTYGASGSGAAYINDTFFSGTGVLGIVPEPSTFALLATGLFGLIAYAWRRRK